MLHFPDNPVAVTARGRAMAALALLTTFAWSGSTLAGTVEEPVPLAAFPVRPASLPDGLRPALDPRGETHVPAAWFAPRSPASQGSTLFPSETLGTFSTTGLSRVLLGRMRDEARRYRAEAFFDPTGILDVEDSVLEGQRADEAQRIVKRASRRTLDGRLEQVARSSPALAGLLDRADGLGAWRGPGTVARTADGPAGTPGSPENEPPTVRMGLKIDAHPRLVLRTEFLGIRGRLELPLLDDALRVAFERPLGSRAHAVLNGGMGRDGNDWATLNFHIRF